MRLRFHHSRWLIAAVAWSAASFAVIGQAPAPTTQNPAGQVQAPRLSLRPLRARAAAADSAADERMIRSTPTSTGRQPPLLAKTPEEQLKTFILQPGYRLELVLADPIIQEPTAIAFDGNGRILWSRTAATAGPGRDRPARSNQPRFAARRYRQRRQVKKHTVFVDNLVFPRFVTPFGPGVILTQESTRRKYGSTPTPTATASPTRRSCSTPVRRAREHRGTGSVPHVGDGQLDVQHLQRVPRPLDAARRPQGADRQQQWRVGVTRTTTAGSGSRAARPSAVGISVPHCLRQLQRSRPVRTGLPHPVGRADSHRDMAGGMAVTRMPDGSLKSATSSAGNDVFRGHRLPGRSSASSSQASRSPASSGRFTREQRRSTILHNAYPGNEFIKSLDPSSHPVDLRRRRTGHCHRRHVPRHHPGRELHGTRFLPAHEIGVQPGQGDPQGPHLALRLRRRRAGSIGQAAARRTMPRMHNATAAQLVRHLSHPNGWWRDTAQQLLVLKQDKSVVPALQAMVRTSPNLLARFHALWTLEGLGALSATLVRQQLEDPEPRVRIQAIAPAKRSTRPASDPLRTTTKR